MPSYRVRREAGEFDAEKQRRKAEREAAKTAREQAAGTSESKPQDAGEKTSA